MNDSKDRIRRLTAGSVIAVLAFLMVAVCRIPMISFLSYEPKDVLLVIGGFLYGPVTALATTAVTAVLEFLTVSPTGWWGLLMNILSSSAFAATAALVYRKRRTLDGAVIGLACGVLLSTASMMLWNWLVTPIYTGWPRSVVTGLLVPLFLPYNLIKDLLNAGLAMVLYKPVTKALRAARLAPPSSGTPHPVRTYVWVVLAAAAVIVCCVCTVLLIRANPPEAVAAMGA